MKTIKLFEHQILRLGKDDQGVEFSRAHLESLARFSEKHQDQFFSLVHNGIKFTSYVGVLRVGNLQIEILPKADKLNDRAADKGKWHDALVYMLRECRYVKLSRIANASLVLQHASILDLFIEVFLAETEELCHHGLIKRYQQKEENHFKYKGKILFPEQIKHNIIHQERMYSQYQSYDSNHLVNQILFSALKIIPYITNTRQLLDRCRQLLLYYPPVDEIRISQKHFDRIVLDRKTRRYQLALEIARLLLLNYSQDLKGGSNNVLSLLFDMNELFEEFIYRQLLKLQATHNLNVKRQQSRRFWEQRSIRPDILIEIEGQRLVLDTKWKVLEQNTPSDADLKQMYAYNHFFKAKHSVLIYPKVHDLAYRRGRFLEPYYLSSGEQIKHECHIAFVDLFENERFSRSIGQKLLAEILHQIAEPRKKAI